jgi:hypothetical protein
MENHSLDTIRICREECGLISDASTWKSLREVLRKHYLNMHSDSCKREGHLHDMRVLGVLTLPPRAESIIENVQEALVDDLEDVPEDLDDDMAEMGNMEDVDEPPLSGSELEDMEALMKRL